jgi:mono/diheme cytochrome c family protein
MARKIFKWIGVLLGGLVGLLVLALVTLFLIGSAKLSKKYDVPVERIAIPTDTRAVQRGEHLATIFLCQRCHGDDLGGQVYFEIPGMLSIPTPNLTSGAGGVGGSNTDEDWVRAIWHGVGKDGRALFFMIPRSFRQMGEADTGALIAYLKSAPPVDNVLPERSLGPVARVMLGAGMLPPFEADLIDHNTAVLAAPAPGFSVEYGQVLGSTCTECHGEKLNGMPFGPPGQEILTPNLTTGGEMASWSEEDFVQTLRTGVTPYGKPISEEMPWKYFGQMTDDELKALWMYLSSLPPLEQGGSAR